MPIQCKGFSACIRHFSLRVRSPRAAALILAGVPGENLRCDVVVVQRGGKGGTLPPYLPEPVPQIVTALDPEAGTLALLDPAGAVPAAVALIAVQLFPFWKRFPFFHSSGHSSQSTGYYKQIKHLVVLVVCQLLDRFPVASRVRAALFVRSLFDYIECLPTV